MQGLIYDDEIGRTDGRLNPKGKEKPDVGRVTTLCVN